MKRVHNISGHKQVEEYIVVSMLVAEVVVAVRRYLVECNIALVGL